MRSRVAASVVLLGLTLVAQPGCDLVGLTRCDSGACPTGTRCNTETNYCEVPGIVLVSPSPGFVGGTVSVSAELSFSDPSEGPASLTLFAGSQQVELPRSGSSRYVGSWVPTLEGPVSIVVRDPSSDLESDPVMVTVDRTPPVFEVFVPIPQREEGGGFTNREGNAWKRDESVQLQVEAEDAIDVASVQFSLQASVGGSAGTATAFRPVSEDGGTASLYRGTILVDLYEPSFKGDRGNIVVNVSGKDRAGNLGSGTALVPVTRFKWHRSLPFLGRQLEPVIADDGALWTGVVDGGFGQLLRITPGGAMEQFDAPGLVGGLLLAAHPSDLREGVYFTANTDGAAHAPDAGFLRVLHATTREVTNACGPFAGGMHPQMAVTYHTALSGDLGQSVVAAARELGGRLIAARIENGVECVVKTTPLNLIPGSDFGAEFDSVYLSQGTSTSRWNLGPAAWSEAPGWPSPATIFTGIAPNGGELLGTGQLGGNGGLFVLPSAGGAVRDSVVTGSGVARPASFDPSGNAYFGDASGGLVKTSRSGVLRSAAVDAGTAPLIGEDGTVYAIDVNGRLAALDAELQPLWSASDAGVGSNAMLLDCARLADGAVLAGRPGVLYVPSGAALTAYLVDSKGLSADAGWPRARHDNKNTASRTTFAPACPKVSP